MKKLLPLCLMIFTSISLSFSQSNYTGAGISLSFDGNTGSYVDLGDVFNTLSFPFAFEAWVNPESYSPDFSGIFSTDNDELNDNGFWIELNPSGNLEIEFGNGIGSGITARRGFVTEKSVPLNKWTHIALSCKSVTEVVIYINGVKQSLLATEGTSTATGIVHSSASASFGRAATSLNQGVFKGQIDEIKIWKKSRSQVNLRSFMCRTIDPSTTNLIGYWNMDEDYSSNTVMDLSGPAENGLLTGVVTKLTSAAPIGNESIFKYTSNWFEVEVVLYAPSGEKLKTQDISGAGIHVYRVDAYPNSTDSLNLTPAYYFGVFGVEGDEPSGYNFRYKYTTTGGIVTPENESSVRFMSRDDATQAFWTDLNGTLDVNKNWITKHDGQSARGEYIISVNDDLKLSPSPSITNHGELKIYPNPVEDVINIELVDCTDNAAFLRIWNQNGKLMKTINGVSPSDLTSVEVAELPIGIYIVEVFTSSEKFMERFIIQR